MLLIIMTEEEVEEYETRLFREIRLRDSAKNIMKIQSAWNTKQNNITWECVWHTIYQWWRGRKWSSFTIKQKHLCINRQAEGLIRAAPNVIRLFQKGRRNNTERERESSLLFANRPRARAFENCLTIITGESRRMKRRSGCAYILLCVLALWATLAAAAEIRQCRYRA